MSILGKAREYGQALGARIVIGQANKAMERLIANRGQSMLEYLEGTVETHFVERPDSKSEAILFDLGRRHRAAIIEILQDLIAAQADKEFTPQRVVTDLITGLGAIKVEEISEGLEEQILALDDKLAQAALFFVIGMRDTLYNLLTHLESEGLSDMNPGKIAHHIASLRDKLEDEQDRTIKGLLDKIQSATFRQFVGILFKLRDVSELKVIE